MATKSTKSVTKKTPVKRKRATPVKFQDEKVDSIVKEITDNMKNNKDTEAKLEEEIKLEVEEKISEAPGKEAETSEDEQGKNDEVSPSDAKAMAGEKEIASNATDANETDKEKAGEQPTTAEEKSKDEGTNKSEEKSNVGSAVFAPDKSENPFPPLDDEPRRSFKWPLIYFILFLAGMVTGFVVFDQLSSREGGNPISMNRPTPTPTAEPTTIPTPEAPDFSEYTIMLENGSGTAGVAADLQETLEAADFTVSEIGNADNSNYEETVIQVKNGTNTTFLKALRTELEKTYTVAKDTEDLPESEEFDAVVIIGSEKSSN
jgi:hypothetical protein